jgi:DNA-binding beta-propeller fold protein YncE
MFGVMGRSVVLFLLTFGTVIGCGTASRAGGAVILSPGDIVVADQVNQGTSTTDGRVLRVDPLTGVQTTIASGGFLADPNEVAIDATGQIYVTDFNSGGSGIIRIDPLTAIQTRLNVVLPSKPTGITIDSAGMLYVSCQSAATVVRVNPITSAVTVVSSGQALSVPDQLAFGNGGSPLYCADAQSFGGGIGTIVRINTTTGVNSRVSNTGVQFPIGVAVEPDGRLLMSEHELISHVAALYRVDPVAGTTTKLGTQGLLVLPASLAIDQLGRLLVVDLDAAGGNGAVIAVNRATGAQSILSSGGSFVNPAGIAVVPEPTSMLAIALGLLANSARRRA